MVRAAEVGEAGRLLAASLREQRPDVFAGWHPEFTRDGTLVWLGFTREVDTHLDRERATFPHPGALRAFQPSRSWSVLVRLRHELSVARGVDVVTTVIDEFANQVVVTVRGDLEAARQALERDDGAVRVERLHIRRRPPRAPSP